MSYTALIIDDERLSRLSLRKDLEKFPEIEIIGEASGISSARTLIEKTKPDILFLDIQLTDGNGFDLLNNIEYTGEVIFVTAFDEYALRAFDINAIDYLLKPISHQRLKATIEKLFSNKTESLTGENMKLEYNDRLMLMYKKSVNFIKIDTITYIKASRDYSYIYTDGGKEYLSSKAINEWEERLPDKHFCRIHRSTIINFDFIIKISHLSPGSAEVIIQGNNEPLSISRNFFRKLKERYSF